MDWTYSKDKTAIVLEKIPRARKKMTATRLGGVLNMDEWKTPFQMWCEITKLASPPFEGNKYTEAGNAIEPKLIQYIRDNVFDLDQENVKDPIQYWGNIYKDMKYDFFPNTKIFGGMWDAIHLTDGKIDTIIECKTSGRPQDWIDGVPKHYLLQGLMYAKLTGASKVIFPVAFLKEEDYAHPENFVCNNANTTYYTINNPMEYTLTWVDGNDYNITELLSIAEEWYNAFIESGISPSFDEKKDEEYLKLIRKVKPSEDSSFNEMVDHLNDLEQQVIEIKTNSGLDSIEKEIKKLKESIKNNMLEDFTENTTTVEKGGFKLTKSVSKSIDSEKLKEDGLLNKYETTSYKFTLTKIKERKED